jgi:hypothetical protein
MTKKAGSTIKKFGSIIVKGGKNGTVVKNPTGLKMIGKGLQGAVFKISEDRCVKIYAKKSDCISESKALKAARATKIAPTIYEVGPNYIIMEYIKGKPLHKYLPTVESFPQTVAEQLSLIFQKMKKAGFSRIDASLSHLIINEKGIIKVVDHVNSLRKKRAFPVVLFKELTKLNLMDSFLLQVKNINSQQYVEWTRYSNIKG